MEPLRSTRSCNRARTSERGYALAMAIILAVLYFGLIELLMMDSSRELAEARRFRSRIVAQALAENAAELAALHIMTQAQNHPLPLTDWQGTISGRVVTGGGAPGAFVIEGFGDTAGLDRSHAEVKVVGAIVGGRLRIDYTTHKP
jgi:hypothetical protein